MATNENEIPKSQPNDVTPSRRRRRRRSPASATENLSIAKAGAGDARTPHQPKESDEPSKSVPTGGSYTSIAEDSLTTTDNAESSAEVQNASGSGEPRSRPQRRRRRPPSRRVGGSTEAGQIDTPGETPAEQPSGPGDGRSASALQRGQVPDATTDQAFEGREMEHEALAAGDQLEPVGRSRRPSRRGGRHRGTGGGQNRDFTDLSGAPTETGDVAFMHPSEREFAKLLDYYGIHYLYEPRSFPLRWEGNRVVEMHSPDFYLPEQDQYFELTTMKQSLVTQKNRKLRQVRELYPEINIQLLYRRDYIRLLGKYGYGPMVDAEVQGLGPVLFTEERIQERVRELARQITEDYAGEAPVLVGVLRGAFVFLSDLIRAIELPTELAFMSVSRYGGDHTGAVEVTRDIEVNIEGRPVILVEGIVDTGLTLRPILQHLQEKGPSSIDVCAMFDKRARRVVDVTTRYLGFEVPDEFIVGYGLDYNERYRNLPYVATLRVVEPKAVPQR